jgi:multidrug efflux pump subunit AcrA (membrane-fusion protein)
MNQSPGFINKQPNLMNNRYKSPVYQQIMGLIERTGPLVHFISARGRDVSFLGYNEKPYIMKRKIFNTAITLSIITIAILVSAFMIRNKPEPERDLTKQEVLYVKTETATTSTIHPEASYRGRVVSLENVVLSAEVSGKILPGDVPLKEGQSFQKGEVLVHIYSEDMKASLQSMRSSYLQLMSSALPDLKIDYPDQYKKWSTFFNKIDINSMMPALPAIESEKERVFAASKNILSQYYSIIQQEINFKRYTIYAPFDGTYKTVKSEVGSIASMNMQIAMLIRTDEMEVIVPVLPEELEWIGKGMGVELNRNNGRTVTGRVSRIAGFIDPGSQSVNIYVSVKNNHSIRLLEGEYVEAEFTSRESLSGMVVPREALLNENSIYVLENGKIEERQVSVLERLEDSYIIDGYKEGEIVIVESLVDVKPGQLAAPIY